MTRIRSSMALAALAVLVSAGAADAGTQRYPVFHSNGGRAQGTMEWRGNGVRDGAYRASFRGTVQDMSPNFRCAYAVIRYKQPYRKRGRIRFFLREELAGQACGFTSTDEIRWSHPAAKDARLVLRSSR